ncbi:peptidylprolyl isomerase [Rhodohalobacter mucosus]|nr:peptidylprolyl isomerase [Rhodohalobacter mucosus]
MDQNPVVRTEYPAMAEAIVNRETVPLYELTTHPDPAAASLALRALAKAGPGDEGAFMSRFMENPASIGGDMWYALSFWQHDDQMISRINRAFLTGEITDSPVCELFYRQGDEGSLEVLFERPDLFQSSGRCALALSTLMIRSGEDYEQREQVIRSALTTAEPEAAKALLYGFYRGSSGGSVISPESVVPITEAWAEYGVGSDPEVDKYMVRILGGPALMVLFETSEPEKYHDDVQLWVEVAKVAARNSADEGMKRAVDEVMRHKNAHVPVQFMESLRLSGDANDDLIERIENSFAKHTRNDEIFFGALRLLHDHERNISPYKEKMEFYADRNPYLSDRALPLFRSVESTDEYGERLLIALEQGGVGAMHATRDLLGFWMENRSAENDDVFRERIRYELERGNRSVMSAIQPILLNDELIPDSFAEPIEQAHQRARQDQVRDNAMVLRQVLEDRFPDTLNEVDPLEPEPLRIPDWQRLYEMGTQPHWILETEKGTIDVRMDPLSAPFTVSSIDSLTRTGLYDGVAFHRVVRNFVIQGGDYDRRDGFGGPDYRIPSEPSFDHYLRGSAGIASSGTDTEGSQFFFMHERAPHLDGNYTRFGEVVRGMDVVDRIQVGDKIIRARISIR